MLVNSTKLHRAEREPPLFSNSLLDLLSLAKCKTLNSLVGPRRSDLITGDCPLTHFTPSNRAQVFWTECEYGVTPKWGWICRHLFLPELRKADKRKKGKGQERHSLQNKMMDKLMQNNEFKYMRNVFVQRRPVRYWDCQASCRSWGAALGSPVGLQGLTLAYPISVFFHLVLPVTSRWASRPSTLPILSYCPFCLVKSGTYFLAAILHHPSAMALHLHSVACLSLALSWGEDQAMLII